MRVIFVNLHCNVFVMKPLSFIIRGRSYPTYKYAYLLKYLLKENKEVAVYINEKGTTAPDGMKNIINNRISRRLEFYLVLLFNGINPFRIKIIEDYKEINRNDDVVLSFYYYPDNLLNMEKYNCYKVLFGNHFSCLNSNSTFAKYKINSFINEVDIKNNDFIQRYFDFEDIKFYILPFVYQKRFIKNKSFYDRKNKALAIGTIAYIEKKEFYDFYKTKCLQPMRKEIYNNQKNLKEYIDSYISDIYENELKSINEKDNMIVKYFKKIYNYFYDGKQSKYHSFDMVEKFNEYRMFVCPEEITGVPGIGFVEGMACGCAYIGLDHAMYRDLGLIPGFHYIGYDGSIEDLTKKIAYYQAHEKELGEISVNGYKYIRRNFNTQTVAKKFFADLNKISMK